eukprot:365634-Chlamydomonas_euryale.AAC.5
MHACAVQLWDCVRESARTYECSACTYVVSGLQAAFSEKALKPSDLHRTAVRPDPLLGPLLCSLCGKVQYSLHRQQQYRRRALAPTSAHTVAGTGVGPSGGLMLLPQRTQLQAQVLGLQEGRGDVPCVARRLTHRHTHMHRLTHCQTADKAVRAEMRLVAPFPGLPCLGYWWRVCRLTPSAAAPRSPPRPCSLPPATRRRC